jgi:hypothetical protein
MSSGPSVSVAKSILDCYFGGIAPSDIPSLVEVRMWTVAPAFDGTGGTAATSAGSWPVLAMSAAVAGGVGQIAKVLTSAQLLFVTMTQASTAVVAFSTHNVSTGGLVWLNNSWTSPVSWSAGESPLIPATDFFGDIVPA